MTETWEMCTYHCFKYGWVWSSSSSSSWLVTSSLFSPSASLLSGSSVKYDIKILMILPACRRTSLDLASSTATLLSTRWGHQFNFTQSRIASAVLGPPQPKSTHPWGAACPSVVQEVTSDACDPWRALCQLKKHFKGPRRRQGSCWEERKKTLSSLMRSQWFALFSKSFFQISNGKNRVCGQTCCQGRAASAGTWD